MADTVRVIVRGLAINAAVVLVLGIRTADAGTILWHWTGPVTGYSNMFHCEPGTNCGLSLSEVVPLGTTIDVSVSINLPLVPPNPQIPCYRGTASTSLQVLGRTYNGNGHVWDEGWGFGPGLCQPGYDVIEIVAPSWGSGGPALPDGWIPFISFDSFLPGMWWEGDLTNVQPSSISSQFLMFYKPGLSRPQRFTADTLQSVPADIQPVPEPTTLLLFGTGLAAAAWRRRHSA